MSRADEYEMGSVVDIAWSESVDAAAWLSDRLTGPAGSTVSSIIPGGFEAYARVLHPARLVEGETERNVRWAQVAEWSKMPLNPDARFHSVALPTEDPGSDELKHCRPPRRGSLTAADGAALAAFLRPHTTAPNSCWFCVWEGYGWQGKESDPIPHEVLEGDRVRLPRGDYVLYRGQVEAASALHDPDVQTPNLWWPEDRSWCVATDIDLPWTYVGGTARMVEELLEVSDLEVLPAGPGDPVRRVEDRVHIWIYHAVTELIRNGSTRLETTRGAIDAWFVAPGLEPGDLGITSDTDDGRRWGKKTRIEHRLGQDMRSLLSLHMTIAVMDLAEG
jgi:hypothetical protein